MLDIHLEVIKMSREEIIAKIKGIAENEKFKIDAFSSVVSRQESLIRS